MENFVVSARKYRPQKFEDVVGQQSITKTLENAITNNHLAQAFLFCGPRGVGKTTCARILAKTINARSMGDDYTGEEDFSFNIFELDAASNNSVEDIRSLTDQVRFAPQVGSYKVYIIDEVHMLSQAAFNAFLKTLEEPPPYAIFILATTEKHKIIPTILSRCQIFDFKRIEVKDTVEHLKTIAQNEGVTIEDSALHIIGQKADGALRDALSIFDQVVSFSGNNITYQNVIENLNVLDYDYYFKVTDFLYSGNYSDVLVTYDEILYKGFDGHNFINGLASHFRDLLMCKNKATLKLLEVADNIKEKYYQQANQVTDVFIFKALKFCNECDINYKSAKNQRLLIEYALIQICGINAELIEKKNTSLKQNTETKSIQVSENQTVAKIPEVPNKQETTEVQKPSVEIPKPSEETILKAEPKPQPIAEEPKIEIRKTISNPTPNKGKAMFGKVKTKMSLGSLLQNSDLGKEKKEEEVVEETTVSGPIEDFSLEQLKNAWNEYSERLQNNNDVGFFYNSFVNVPIELKDKTSIYFTLHSATEEKEWQNRKPDLLEFLRNKLQNFALTISWEVKVVEGTVKYYTNRDKFVRMAEKNPTLLELKKRLNLELE